jgi:MFS superfamily sulfate permease-like transporter
LTLTSLSSCLYYIPMAVLGAVIENAIINLIDVHEVIGD